MAELCRHKLCYEDPIKKINYFTYLDGPEGDNDHLVDMLCHSCSGVRPEWVTSIEIVKRYGMEVPSHDKG